MKKLSVIPKIYVKSNDIHIEIINSSNIVKKSAASLHRYPFIHQYRMLTFKAPITTAADDEFWDIFPNFRQK